jgi:uncharacterized protein (DUF1015 family)
MPKVLPFHSLTYDPAAGPIGSLTAPPYDIISGAQRREFLDGSPYSIAHVDLGADGDAGIDRYRLAGDLLADWRARRILVPADGPTYYASEMRFDSSGVERVIRGLYAALHLEDWGGSILPHEETMPEPIEDRLRLLRATRTHLSAVYGSIPGPAPAVTRALEDAALAPPLFELTDEQGVTHRVWSLEPEPALAAEVRPQPFLIADGHHRYEAALRFRNEMWSAGQHEGLWDRTLALIVDAETEELPVLPFHRIQLRGDVPRTREWFSDLDSLLRAVDDDSMTWGIVLPGRTGPRFGLGRLEGEPPAVRALHEQLLDRVAPGSALRFVSNASEAVAAVASGSAVAAHLLPPTTPARIHQAVNLGRRLPRKSTFFWPKPRTGMVMMPLDP